MHLKIKLLIVIIGIFSVASFSAPQITEGAVKWQIKLGEELNSPAIGPDGTIYVVARQKGERESNYLYAITPEGKIKWSFLISQIFEGMTTATPVIDTNGVIYVASQGGFVMAINPNGTLRWKYSTGKIYAPPVIFDGTLYVVSANGELYVLKEEEEFLKVKKKCVIEGLQAIFLALDKDGTIYISSYDNCLYAITPDGKVKWKYRFSTYLWPTSLAIGEETIYVISGDNLYYLLLDGTCKKEVMLTFSDSVVVGPSNTLYVGGRFLYALSPEGEIKWELNTKWPTSVPIIGKDGIIYIACGNVFFALNPDGTKRWECTIENKPDIVFPPPTPVISQDGTIYVATNLGYLYAISSSSLGLADSAWPMFAHDERHTGKR
jgi:outer membrane protein assembly factor BamB